LAALGRVGIGAVVEAAAAVDADIEPALAVKGDGMIGLGQAFDNGFGRGFGDQIIVQRNAHHAGAGGGVEIALMNRDAGALIQAGNLVGLHRFVIGAQTQRDNADRRLVLAVTGGDIDVATAQRHVPDRAQIFRHHSGFKAGRQDQSVGLLRQSRRSRKECGRGGQQSQKGDRKRPDHEIPSAILLVFLGKA
jgi:hypothetical protein